MVSPHTGGRRGPRDRPGFTLNYSALLNAGDFGQALAKQNLVAQTIEVMRHRLASIAV